MFLIAVVFWVKFPEFEPKEWPRRERPTELSPVALRNLISGSKFAENNLWNFHFLKFCVPTLGAVVSLNLS